MKKVDRNIRAMVFMQLFSSNLVIGINRKCECYHYIFDISLNSSFKTNRGCQVELVETD
jgi:hypothetical protein